MNKKIKHSILLIAGLLILNFANQGFYQRFDLTQDKRYTLSEVTSSIIEDIDRQLIVRVYLEGEFPSEFKRLQIETRQFLEELRAKNSKVKIQFINPDSQRERLVKAGMTPSQLTVEEDGKLSNAIIFPWAEIDYKNKTEIVSLLPNSIVQSQEQQLELAIENLEFSFTNAISIISQKNTKKVAVLTGNGELEDIQAYSFLKEVTKKYRLAKFTLDSVQANPQRSLQDIQSFDLAIISKPTQAFTEEEKMVLDQFIMNGGKTLWMLDNVQADTDSLFNGGKMLAYPRDLNLTDQLFSYGVRINTTLIQDLYAAKIPLATGNIGNQTQFQNLPWFYHPLVGGNTNHPITKNMVPVRLRFANQIDTLKNNIKKTPLLVSSLLTRKTGTPNFIELQSIAKEPTKQEYQSGYQLFSVLLEGEFKSMYANRIKPFKGSFKDKGVQNKMVVVADGDIGRNQILKRQPYDLSVDKWTGEQFGNKEFLLNAVDYLLDDSGLIDLRNKTLQINLLDKQRAFKERTFWQFINVALPLLLLFGFGIVFNYLRKRKYS
ncbi:MAG: gliding motility-associated ABC transporter substrate-binding protein GldG [Flavobacteriaceae bacterium]